MVEESDSPHMNFIRLFRAPLYSRRPRKSKRFGIRAIRVDAAGRHSVSFRDWILQRSLAA
jgi:hypothetical protein